jgi:polyisoprenoid-binding protein YceI
MTILAILATTLVFATTASAEDFSVIEDMSNASFTSSAPLETINGTTSKVTGSISADLSDPSSIRGNVTIPVETLRTGVDERDRHLRGEDWLNASENPNIEFEVVSVERRGGSAELTHGQTAQLTVTGNLTINGVTNEVTVPAQATYYVIEGSELEGTYGVQNNLLRVVSNFAVALDDYNVNIPAPLQAKVSNQIDLQIRLTAVQQ